MELIEGVALSKLCDYSFGDQSGQWGNIYTSFMEPANLLNLDFVNKLYEVKKERDSKEQPLFSMMSFLLLKVLEMVQ